MPMKIASRKNEKPSIAKPRPNTLPKVPVKFGHRRPISKLRIVPVTTPAAKSAAITFVQRRAIRRYTSSPVRMCIHSAKSTSAGKAMPKQTSGMWTANDSACICRACSRYCWWAGLSMAARLMPGTYLGNGRGPTYAGSVREVRTEVAALVAAGAAFVATAPPAAAAGWSPHAADATWTYQWTDSVYQTTPTNEIVTVDAKNSSGPTFALDWTTDNANNPDGAVSSNGTVWFQDTEAGIFNPQPGWSSTPPPSQFPVLCATI